MHSLLNTLKRPLFQNGVILFAAIFLAFSGYYLERPFFAYGKYGTWQYLHIFFAYCLLASVMVALYTVRKIDLSNVLIIVLAGISLSGPGMISNAPANAGLFVHIVISFILLSAVVLRFYKSLLTSRI